MIQASNPIKRAVPRYGTAKEPSLKASKGEEFSQDSEELDQMPLQPSQNPVNLKVYRFMIRQFL